MTRHVRIVFCLLLLTFVALPSFAQTASLTLPPYKKVVLQNGLTLLLMEQHEVPIISLATIVKAGSVADPAGKEGVASLTAELLRKGTTTRSADVFAEALDSMGGSFRASANLDGTRITAEFMTKDVTKGLDLVADALLRPTFPEEEVSKVLKQRVDGIKAAKDRAAGVISTYYYGYLFGKHPYARPTGGDETSLTMLTRADAATFHERYYAPGGTVMVVAGDFVTVDMEKSLTALFGKWPSRRVTYDIVPDATPVVGRRLLLVDKPDSTQTYFYVGNVGISPTNPDRVVIDIINTLFGGRFTSMINTELRIKSGLTYGAGSSFTELEAKGPFAITSYTKNASTEKALDLTLDTLRRLHEKGITDEELKSAKAYIKGQFPPTIETSNQLASQLANLTFNGLDEREVNQFYAKVDAATMADVTRVIQQYFPLDNLVFVLIGKTTDIEGIAKKYAPTVDRKSIGAVGF
jgi:zinc protease